VLNEIKNSFFGFALEFFSENLGAVSEEQGELFHQHIKEMERRYQGQWNVNKMGDYCRTLHPGITETSHKKKINRRSFAGKIKIQHKVID
jgi:hypothetical protein